jgi:competence protein ComEA
MHTSGRRPRALARTAMLALVPMFLVIGAGAAVAAPPAQPSPVGVVNVNTATATELERLPGIGEAKAKAILEERKARGGFKTVEELEDVQGIGKAALERLRPYVSVEGKTTAKSQ